MQNQTASAIFCVAFVATAFLSGCGPSTQEIAVQKLDEDRAVAIRADSAERARKLKEFTEFRAASDSRHKESQRTLADKAPELRIEAVACVDEKLKLYADRSIQPDIGAGLTYDACQYQWRRYASADAARYESIRIEAIEEVATVTLRQVWVPIIAAKIIEHRKLQP